MFEEPGLLGKAVVITGGSRGIGRELVLRFAEEGSRVAFLYREDQKAAEAVCAAAESAGHPVTALKADVRDRQACEEAIGQAAERFEGIDVLVNNSGVIRDNLLAFFTDEELREVIDTNVLGVFHAIRAVVPEMVSRRSGKIINISSAAAGKGGRGQTNYAASKGAIEAMTRSLAVELSPKKITVNAVAPGVIETDMSRPLLQKAGEEVKEKILLRRFGRPEEVAAAVLFLASRFGDYITGEVLHVDGGFKME
jgi:3-oxoacyl-[acyl-carrier protein] reductase